ncbi:MAG TPA: hypothetical protein VNX67_01135 [Solirubrobacteraceae bacterium]|jgi:hypothetical protein|nr:hypothetical protein [Solirubrobacteraceae bacterium]
MARKHDAHRDELEGVAQRLRDERPQASPLDLDRIKTTAMARAKAGSGHGRAGARRLAVAGLTVGLLVATTGGVLAGESGGHKGKGGGSGNAANAQYGGECNINNGNANNGDNNGQGAENNACNENIFITETNNSTTTITNNYNSSTVTVAGPANSGVLGATTTKKAKTSSKHIKIHINLPRRSKLRKVTLRVNGKIVSVLKGKKASKNITLVSLPCSATVTITAVTASGKTVTQTHTYNLC